MSWDPVTLEIASSRKFRWLRERVGMSSHHTLLLNQIKNFVFTDDVDVNKLCTALKRQVFLLFHTGCQTYCRSACVGIAHTAFNMYFFLGQKDAVFEKLMNIKCNGHLV